MDLSHGFETMCDARGGRVEAEKRLKRRTRVIFDRVSKAPFVTHK